jgi:hypothetical protein
MEFLKMLILNDIAYSADLACVRKATPTNIANCWKYCVGEDDKTQRLHVMHPVVI